MSVNLRINQFFVFAYNLVLEKGAYMQNTERVELDVEDADIRWTFWDDDGSVLSVETLAVKDNNLIVVWEDGQEDDFIDLEFEEDEDGNTLAEYIIDIIEKWAKDTFEEDEEEVDLPYDKVYLSDAYHNLKGYLTLEDFIQHMFDYFTSKDLHDFAEHLLEELELDVKDVMQDT